MRILLVGSGGREHALAWKLAQSDDCTALYCAPGNAGINQCADCVDIGAENIDALVAFAKAEKIDLVVVGPEAPLVLGLADRLKAENIAVFGPSAAAAQLEGSKAFMKDLCTKYNVQTAAYGRFTDIEKAKEFIAKQGAPIVVKADGLAAGKGVIIAETVEEAEKAAEDMLSGASFGDAGAEIVIEEFMEGEELSFFAIADGQTMLSLSSAQDHKRAYDGDQGPNTGGMGAYSPAHLMTEALGKTIEETIITPFVEGMAADGIPFTGILFAGIMVVDGVPKLLEFNVRFGDPECQALMMRLESDLARILMAAAQGDLASVAYDLKWKDETALCVVMAAEGYPGAYKKGTVINNIHEADSEPYVKIFHAGTAAENDRIVNAGGRVLGVTALGADVAEARTNAYNAIDKIEWPEGFCRKDIGWRAVA